MKRFKLKKPMAFLLSGIMAFGALTALPLTAGAAETTVEAVQSGETYTSGDYKYRLLDDGTAEITDYNGSATELEIPSTLDGYKVTSIGDWAFASCDSLASVAIGNGVTSIGDAAFSDCSSLTSITIPDSVTSIGDYAFGCCNKLTSVTIPDSVTSIGDYAFGYDWDDKNGEDVKIDDFTIYGYTGTAAETYANDNDFTFVALDGTTEPTTPDNPVDDVKLGDVNGDGTIDISDATEIQKAVAKITTFTDAQKTAADVNGDGTIDISDATMIQKYVAKIITEFAAVK